VQNPKYHPQQSQGKGENKRGRRGGNKRYDMCAVPNWVDQNKGKEGQGRTIKNQKRGMVLFFYLYGFMTCAVTTIEGKGK